MKCTTSKTTDWAKYEQDTLEQIANARRQREAIDEHIQMLQDRLEHIVTMKHMFNHNK